MRVLRCHENESIVIGDNIKITVIEIGGGKCRLGIEAPDHVGVDREEVRRSKERGECPICRGSGWVAWVQDFKRDVDSLLAVPTSGPPNLNARPCPKCRKGGEP